MAWNKFYKYLLIRTASFDLILEDCNINHLINISYQHIILFIERIVHMVSFWILYVVGSFRSSMLRKKLLYYISLTTFSKVLRD